MSEPNSNNSPEPGTPQTASKAVASAIVTMVVAALFGVIGALADEIISPTEWLTIALAVVMGGASSFGITYQVPNRLKA